MAGNEAVDFGSLDTTAAADKAFELELLHPATKKPLGVFVSVLGMESDKVKARVRREVNRDRRRAFEAQRKGQPIEPNMLEEDEAESVALVAELVAGWRTVTNGKSEPVIHWGTEKLEFNADNVRRWLENFSWTRVQILEASKDLRNYLGN